MPRTIEQTVYQFAELSDNAKERAREWWREHVFSDNNDYDHVIEDAAQCGAVLGIDFRTRRRDPCVYWSGFSSQGDGALFEGNYSYAKGAARKIRAHAPQDAELHKIADELTAIQRRNFYALSAVTRQRGHYNHSGCMAVDVSRDDGREPTEDAEDAITETLRSFADWIYHQLEREYEYQMSDEVVDETIAINEYEFDEEGHRA